MNVTAWPSDQPIASPRDAYISFGDLKMLECIPFGVMKGKVMYIIGPSGSGKSALIRCINAINGIQAVSITVQGQEVHSPNPDRPELRKMVGTMFRSITCSCTKPRWKT